MITVTGASDDLIEIEGDIIEEFNIYLEEGEPGYVLAFSDGTLLGVNYDENGLWRFPVMIAGRSRMSIKFGEVDKDTNDTVTLTGEEIKWVVCGQYKVYRRPRKTRKE